MKNQIEELEAIVNRQAKLITTFHQHWGMMNNLALSAIDELAKGNIQNARQILEGLVIREDEKETPQ